MYASHNHQSKKKTMDFLLRTLAVGTLAALIGPCHAVPLFFTDRTLFDIAVANEIGDDVRTVDFDSLTAGTLLPVNSTLTTSGGSATSQIRLEYVLGDGSSGTLPAEMQVSDLFDTTSGENYLGINDPGNFDQFVAGQVFNLALGGPFNALGLYFITGDPLLPGDIVLQTGGVAGDVATDGIEEFVLDDGGLVYFLGIVSPTQTFGRGSIRFGPRADGAFLFNVDDIVIARVSEPATVVLIILGWLVWRAVTVRSIGLCSFLYANRGA